ncbi:flavodoxin family protein [Embleya scabrispora]|uniref:flavodoxin family protein n=1 Tax=Embleya scabrispora TaxID=159449 RepID=UPI003CCC05D1
MPGLVGRRAGEVRWRTVTRQGSGPRSSPLSEEKMRVLVVTESCFGNTSQVAEAIIEGLRSDGAAVEAVSADSVPSSLSADLVLVGAPTHNMGLPSSASRGQAAQKGGSAPSSGVREWIDRVDSAGSSPFPPRPVVCSPVQRARRSSRRSSATRSGPNVARTSPSRAHRALWPTGNLLGRASGDAGYKPDPPCRTRRAATGCLAIGVAEGASCARSRHGLPGGHSEFIQRGSHITNARDASAVSVPVP